jgi:hypothetical protein
MPVLVTAADRPLARRLVHRLLEEGGEVRAYGDGVGAAVRAAGAFVAEGTPDDIGRLEAAMIDVHTVVHLAGDVLARDAAELVATAEVVVRAATSAQVRRLIVTSLPGAAADAVDPLRRAAHEVEVAAATAGPPSIVLRHSLLDTPALRDALSTVGLTDDERARVVAPVRVEDLLELVVAFDRARSQAPVGHLVVAADGPERSTVARYLERVGVGRAGTGGLVGRRLLGDDEVPLLRPALAAGPWWSEGPAVLDGWGFAGIEPGVPGRGPGPAPERGTGPRSASS